MLTIDPRDTNWLKMLGTDADNVNKILVYGSLKIDSVKITSWNQSSNYYTSSNGSGESYPHITHSGTPRPFIAVEPGATGTTNITNSEIAYLGYEGGIGKGTSGLEYRNAGDGSILRGNNIHDLYFGFYSDGVSGIIIENNQFHNNGHYGIDPHTGTHDMIIRHNVIYDNNGSGIICSLNCYNMLIEDNKVYNNTGGAIAFTRIVANSIVRDNYIEDQSTAIFVSQFRNGQIYNNTISNDDRDDAGIVLSNVSSFSKIFHNIIHNIGNGITIEKDSNANTIYYNTIFNPGLHAIVIDNSNNNTIYSNQIINSQNPHSKLDNNNFAARFVPIVQVQDG